MNRPFDLIVYGATGYTGKLVVEYLSTQIESSASGLRWAIAGRSAAKLAEVAAELHLPTNVEQIVADSQDLTAMRDLASKAKCILTTVGPYQLYGNELVAACAQLGTDYVDLCGEPVWMRKMIDAHEASAKQSGARIVFSCGFDSIPFDLGVWFLQQHLIQARGASASRVMGRVRKMKGKFSGGTAASLKATMQSAAAHPEEIALLKNPFSLTPGFSGPAQPTGHKPYFEAALNSWMAPFIMAPINTRNVHRTNYLTGHLYGEGFVYDEMMMTGPGEKGEQIAMMVASDKSLSDENAPKPGEGPTPEERKAGSYDVAFFAEDFPSTFVTVTGDMDPGYGSTSKMISQSALCLVFEQVPTQGGIWTPGALMAEPLIARLQKFSGLKFSTVSTV